MTRDLGDFQTPPELVDAVLRCVAERGPFARALEPSCGRGNFIAGLLRLPRPPTHILGLELQERHVTAARRIAARAPDTLGVEVRQADLFDLDLRGLAWQSEGPLLVVGNPPWVTNAELGVLGSPNRPARRKLEGLGGLAARTGASNFDLAEAVWLKLLEELGPIRPLIALLCKQTVARRVLQQAGREGIALEDVALYAVDGPRWFGAQVAACLMVARVAGASEALRAAVYDDLEAQQPRATIGLVDGRLVADLETYGRVAALDGRFPLEWRQGVKHDAAAIMELRHREGSWKNGLGEVVDVEPEAAFPLLKATHLARDRWPPTRRVLVTQRKLDDDPSDWVHERPLLCRYLDQHGPRLDARRSSIYRGRPRFAMFGVGPYTFASWKVAVSGLHTPARFRVVGPHEGRPVLFDDTCYQVACDGPAQTAVLAAALNSAPCRGLLRALTFPDAKRPVTKRLLSRIELPELLGRVGADWLVAEGRRSLERFGVVIGSAEALSAVEELTRTAST